MNHHNRGLLANANIVLELLSQAGFQGIICGGFARDVHYERNAKDIDIAVGVQEFSISDLAALVDSLEEHYVVKAHWTGEPVGREGKPLLDPRDPNSASEVSDEEHCVRLVVQLPRLQLDIVFYDTEHEGGNLVAQHDCNLNQFAICGTTPVFLGTFHPDKHGLRLTREGLHPARVKYMEDKWEAIQGGPTQVNHDIPFA